MAKNPEGFAFEMDLQVQIYISETRPPRGISTVGSIWNQIDEVLQAAVGNHFRDTLQSMPAVRFVEERGVDRQDVLLPQDLVKALTEREIAKQEIAMFEQEKQAQLQRIETEQARGTADRQAERAKSKVGVTIKVNNPHARKPEADGEAFYIEQTGTAKAEVL